MYLKEIRHLQFYAPYSKHTVKVLPMTTTNYNDKEQTKNMLNYSILLLIKCISFNLQRILLHLFAVTLPMI